MRFGVWAVLAAAAFASHRTAQSQQQERNSLTDERRMARSFASPRPIWKSASLPAARVVAASVVMMVGVGLKSAVADTVWRKGAGGAEEVCARDVIVTNESDAVVAYRFLDHHVVASSTCTADLAKGESLRTILSPRGSRRALIKHWQEVGRTVQVTDVSGVAARLFNFALYFDNPTPWIGRARFGEPIRYGLADRFRVKAGEATVAISIDDVEQLIFDGETLRVKSSGGSELVGTLVPEEDDGIARIRGIRDLGDSVIADYEILLKQVKSVVFQPKPQ